MKTNYSDDEILKRIKKSKELNANRLVEYDGFQNCSETEASDLANSINNLASMIVEHFNHEL